MTLPSQSLGSTRYRRRSKSTSRSASSPTKRLLAVAAAMVFVVLAVVVIRNVTGSPDKQAALPEPTDDPAHVPAGQEASLTTEPRVISPRKQIPTQSAAQPATNTDQNRPAAHQPTQPARTSPEPFNPAASAAGAQLPDNSAQQPSDSIGEVGQLIARGQDLWQLNKPVEARDLLNRALAHPRADGAHQQAARALIAEINDLLVFSPRVVPGDPVAITYQIQSGDSLSKIARSQSVHTDWRLLMRINNISAPERIRADQKIKLLKGPFHAVVHKSCYRIDFYADATDSAGNRLYVCSRPCGLGEFDSTPTGMFKVRRDSKLVNPHWVNPRTGERFDADDPENPIGERWIGLEGTEAATETLSGYGIHGTIDPASIGGQESMGCIRLLPADVELAYELLVFDLSTVEILP